MASKLNKKELYEEFKKLQKENTKLQLFLNNSEDVRNKQKIVIECQEEEIKQLHKNLYKLQEENKLNDEIISLHETDEWNLYKKPCNNCATINMPCVCRYRDDS